MEKSHSNLHEDDERSVLLIKNIKKGWTHLDVKNFIKQKCKSKAAIDGMEFVYVAKDSNKCSVHFVDALSCEAAFDGLFGTNIDGMRVFVLRVAPSSRYLSRLNRVTENALNSVDNQTSKPNPRITPDYLNQPPAVATHETYGLSMKFLTSLNITLPLINRIFIRNLSPMVDENKLREVFSYAGQIMQIILIPKENRTRLAKIEFDHPVEAVQAIAMFNNQELYDKTMHVQLDTLRDIKNIPEGLSGFGPGLGIDGEPLRNVRMHVELAPIKTLLTREINKLQQSVGQEQVVQPFLTTPVQESNVVNPFNPVTAWNLNTFLQTNPLQNITGFVQPQGLTNFQLLQNLMQQNLSSIPLKNVENQLIVNQGTVPLNKESTISDRLALEKIENKQNETLQNDWLKSGSDLNNPPRLSRFDDNRNVGDRESQKRSWTDRDDPEEIQTDSDMLVFTNLPPSVTVRVMKAKMREVGEVKFVDLTGNGRALVRFFRSADAERCQKLFNESKVDGRIITVKFF